MCRPDWRCAVSRTCSPVLATQKDPLPADLALILPRYQQSGIFGPPRAPVKVEKRSAGSDGDAQRPSDDGTTPLTIEGGRPDVDFLTLELPGMRKLRRPLGSGENLFCPRPEDRLPLLFDQVAGLPIGSEQQTAVLKELAGSPAVATKSGRACWSLGPKLRDGKPVVGESLVARVFDFARKDYWPIKPKSRAEMLHPRPPRWLRAVDKRASASRANQITRCGHACWCSTCDGDECKGTKLSPAEKSSGSKLPFAKTKAVHLGGGGRRGGADW